MEPSLIHYARFHSLATNHRATHPLSSSLIPPQPSNYLLQAADPEDLPHVELPALFTVNERLPCSIDSAKLLAICSRWPLGLPEEVWDDAVTHCPKPWDQKVELPILRTDHGRDVRGFGGQTAPDLTNLNIPYEMLDEESGEGTQWTASDLETSERFKAMIQNEKPAFSRDGLICLGDALKAYNNTGDSVDAMENETSRYKKLDFEPATPPLLPLELEPEPFLPSSSVGHLELLSDHTSPTAAECEELMEQLMEKDSLIHPNDELRNSDSSIQDMEVDDPLELFLRTSRPLGSSELPSPPPTKHIPISTLVVEGPLTPPPSIPVPISSVKRVSFPEDLKVLITNIAPAAKEPEHPGSSDMEIEAFLDNTIKPMAEKIDRKLAQEQLKEGHSTKRVDVPTMDFSLGRPPWQTYCSTTVVLEGCEKAVSLQMQLIREMKQKFEKDSRWPGVRRIENELNWVPFPVEFGRVVLQEDIVDDGALSEALEGINSTDAVDLDGMTWKLEGLLILHDDEDDELGEISPPKNSSYRPADLTSLVEKRKIPIDAPDSTGKGKRVKSTTGGYETIQDAEHGRSKEGLTEPRGSILLEGFSAGSSLERFMHFRGVALTNLKQREKAAPVTSTDQGQPNGLGPSEVTAGKTRASTTDAPVRLSQKLPALPLEIPVRPKSFIISTTLLPHRRLLHLIQELYPSASLIERDFSLRQPEITASISAQEQSQTSAFTDEADILLSPSTGLIWTTLQKIKQRPLPGQKAQGSTVQERIARVAKRYQQVIILVSEGLASNTGRSEGLDEKDSDALVDLMGFAAKLGTRGDEVSVIFVAGGEEELGRWIVGLMGRYAVIGEEGELLQDETVWEIFLRRVGMNAFAAQTIMSLLQRQEDTALEEEVSSKEPEPFGLAAFVQMPHEERLRRFACVLGGRKLLDRVHATLDIRWQ